MAKKASAHLGRKGLKVLREFKAGTLNSGKGGPLVKNRKQAIAIALSSQRRADSERRKRQRRGR